MYWLKHSLRFLLVTVGIVVLTSLSIDATEVFNGSQSALGILAKKATTNDCPSGMVRVSLAAEHELCVDVYEASPAASCPITSPANELDTKTNVDSSACVAVSSSDVLPWRFISFIDAQQMCARSAKRLMTSDEWYQLASGLVDFKACHISGDTARASSDQCTSPRGVADLIGNVWEWLDAEVVDGVLSDRLLPPSGYVASVDTHGIALTTSTSSQSQFGNDYILTHPQGVRGLVRGGFYGSKEDAGLFALNASVNLDLKTAGIGFRCVQDI